MEFEFSNDRSEWKRNSPLRLALRADLADLADTVLKARALQAFDCSARTFPVHRNVRYAVRRPIEELFDDLALNTGLVAQRLDTASLLLDGAGVFVSAHGRRKTDYSSGEFDIWAESLERMGATRARLLEIVGEQRVREEIFTIDWHFWTSHSGLSNVAFDELADADVMDEAYPMLGEPVRSFVNRYLSARETVLVLQGPPGTGKTRLVRAILAAMSRRKGDSANVLYTADRRTLENDEIFVEFITGSHDAFVVEDADHVLGARANGTQICIASSPSPTESCARLAERSFSRRTSPTSVTSTRRSFALVVASRCFARVRSIARRCSVSSRRFMPKIMRSRRKSSQPPFRGAAALRHWRRSFEPLKPAPRLERDLAG